MTNRLDPNSPEMALYRLILDDLQVVQADLQERLEKQERMLREIQAHLNQLESQVSALPRR